MMHDLIEAAAKAIAELIQPTATHVESAKRLSLEKELAELLSRPEPNFHHDRRQLAKRIALLRNALSRT